MNLERIYSALIELGISERDLANELNIPITTFIAWINNKTIKARDIYRISQYLKIPIQEFFIYPGCCPTCNQQIKEFDLCKCEKIRCVCCHNLILKGHGGWCTDCILWYESIWNDVRSLPLDETKQLES